MTWPPQQTTTVAAALSELRGGEVAVTAPAEVADALNALGRTAVVSPYLLAPGVIADRITDAARSARAIAAAPLGNAPELVEIVVDRFVAEQARLARNVA